MTLTGYRVNDAQIVAELFDNEAIVMNLSNGSYFTLSGTAAEVWSMIEAGFDSEGMAARLVSKHGVDASKCRADIDALMASLLNEQIVLEAEAHNAPSDPGDADFGPYATPILTLHDDMAEIMAMDPPLPELTAANSKDT